MWRRATRSITGAMPALVRRIKLPRLLLPLLAAGTLGAACSGHGVSAPTPTGTPAGPQAATPAPSSPTGLPSVAGLSIPVAGQPPATGHPWFLTIGDSVTSGFTVDVSRNGVNSAWAVQLQHLLAAQGRDWTLYDTACPGERTSTYTTQCPGRTQIPFLAGTSQHDAAMAAITAHRADLRAVFVELGSNDLLDSERRNEQLPAAIAALRTALTGIVTELRRAAPGVPVILCNFYDPLANAVPATVPELNQVNAMVAQVAQADGARLADFHGAVNTVSTGVDDHLCSYVDCAHGDVHPTIQGHARLAQAALSALDAR